MKKVSTGISPDFVVKWTGKEAVREVLQNYLDSLAEFDCKGSISLKDGIATVRDYGPGIQMKHFALGVTDKSDDSIGRFGKGLKQALLVFAREGRYCSILSNGLKITPAVEYDENYQTDVMVLNISELKGSSKRIKGAMVEFECSEEEMEEAKSYFIQFQRGKVKMLTDKISSPGGTVYVNGSKIGEVENALFSYHLNHAEADDVMSSDRDMIDTGKLDRVVMNIFADTMDDNIIRMLYSHIFTSFDPHRYWEASVGFNWSRMEGSRREEWKELFFQMFGRNAVVSDVNYETAQRFGYHPINVPGYWAMCIGSIGVLTATEVLREARQEKIETIDIEELTPNQQRNLYVACGVVQGYYGDPGTVLVSKNLDEWLNIAKNSGKQAHGFYKEDADEIYLEESILDSLEKTIHVLLHETVHKYSGAADETVEFEEALCDVATKMMLVIVAAETMGR